MLLCSRRELHGVGLRPRSPIADSVSLTHTINIYRTTALSAAINHRYLLQEEDDWMTIAIKNVQKGNHRSCWWFLTGALGGDQRSELQ